MLTAVYKQLYRYRKCGWPQCAVQSALRAQRDSQDIEDGWRRWPRGGEGEGAGLRKGTGGPEDRQNKNHLRGRDLP